jgi:hypothetical protein
MMSRICNLHNPLAVDRRRGSAQPVISVDVSGQQDRIHRQLHCRYRIVKPRVGAGCTNNRNAERSGRVVETVGGGSDAAGVGVQSERASGGELRRERFCNGIGTAVIARNELELNILALRRRFECGVHLIDRKLQCADPIRVGARSRLWNEATDDKSGLRRVGSRGLTSSKEREAKSENRSPH